jgi:phage tail tape-measure protein
LKLYPRNLLVTSALQKPAPSADRGLPRGIQMKMTKAKTSALPTALPAKSFLAVAAIALALLAIPHIGHAQGLVRGAQEGAAEGNRAAGPVGGVVGGAIGAGVGGAVGAVDGIFGIPDGHRYRCRGFYDRYDRFHCYR